MDFSPSPELAELRQLVETLRGSVRARDDFIAIAAHELRNPMTPIVGVAELALIAARKAEGKCPPRVIILLERLQRRLGILSAVHSLSFCQPCAISDQTRAPQDQLGYWLDAMGGGTKKKERGDRAAAAAEDKILAELATAAAAEKS